MKICIDAGHGGHDPGAVGLDPFELKEKDINLAIARRLEAELMLQGHMGYMTRETDVYVPLNYRATFANNINAHLFISIHCNAATNKSVEGIEVFRFAGSQIGEAKAANVLNKLMEIFPDHNDRGVKTANFAVLRLTNMPAILVECEFITNYDQLLFLSDPNNHIKIAQAIASGV